MKEENNPKRSECLNRVKLAEIHGRKPIIFCSDTRYWRWSGKEASDKWSERWITRQDSTLPSRSSGKRTFERVSLHWITLNYHTNSRFVIMAWSAFIVAHPPLPFMRIRLSSFAFELWLSHVCIERRRRKSQCWTLFE